MILFNAYVNLTSSITPGSGTFLQYTTNLSPQFGLLAYEEGYQMIDSVFGVVSTSAGITAGALGVQLLMPWGGAGGTWVQMTTPNSSTGAAFTLVPTLAANATYDFSLNVSGSIFVPCVGIRLSYSGLAGGNIANAAMFITKR